MLSCPVEVAPSLLFSTPPPLPRRPLEQFAYIGMSAVATFGQTTQDDGTAGEQPWGTVIAYNKVGAGGF